MTSRQMTWRVATVCLLVGVSGIYVMNRLLGFDGLELSKWLGILLIGFIVVSLVLIPVLLIIQPLSNKEKEALNKLYSEDSEQDVADATKATLLELLTDIIKKPIFYIIIAGVLGIILLNVLRACTFGDIGGFSPK